MVGPIDPTDESQIIPEGLDVHPSEVTWPNQMPVVDGVVPMDEIPQDEDFLNDDEDEDLEMED